MFKFIRNFFRRRTPKPIWQPVVGARVLTPKNNVGSVRMIVGTDAWVKTGGRTRNHPHGQNIIVPVAELRQPID